MSGRDLNTVKRFNIRGGSEYATDYDYVSFPNMSNNFA